jgi:hypothetical protein
MRTIAIAVVCFGIGWAGEALPQSAATTGSLANSLATAAGVPLGTVISDLVTKASSNTFISGLQKTLATASQPTTRDATITGLVVGNIARETVKGFLIRDIELDPRFEENIKRVLGQISLDSLIPKSPLGSGLTIPTLNLNQLAVPGLPSINFTRGATPSVTPTTRSANVVTASTEEELSNTRRRWLVHILAAVEQHEREIISARYPDRSRWCVDAGASDRDLAACKVMHQGPPNYGASVAEGTCSLSISPGAERRRVR